MLTVVRLDFGNSVLTGLPVYLHGQSTPSGAEHRSIISVDQRRYNLPPLAARIQRVQLKIALIG